MKLKLAVTPVMLLTGAATMQAYAQDAVPQSGLELDNIIVTARKSQESINEVPLAITAFSSAQLEARNIRDLVDISTFTPGFKFQNQTGAGSSGRNDRTVNSLIFRGLTLSNDYGTRAGSLLFVDGAPIIGGAAPGLMDVERVEVLRGPQSAFFGRSTFSGAINIVTKDPPKTLTIKANASYASYNSHTEQLSIGGPIVGDSLRGRITFTNEDMGGQWKNSAAPYEDLGARRTTSINAQLAWTPGSRFRAKLSVFAFENEDGPPAQASIKQDGMNCNLNPAQIPQSYISKTPAPGDPLVANPQANNRYYCGEIPKASEIPASAISGNYVIDPLVRSAIIGNRRNFPLLFNPDFLQHGGMRRRSLISSLRLEYELPGGATLTSSTAYHTEKVASILDLLFRDGRNIANPLYSPTAANPSNSFYQYTLGYQAKTWDISQEFRLTSDPTRPFRYVLGANYFHADDYFGTVWGQTVFGASWSAATVRYLPRTPAVFGALYYDLDKKLTAIAELRYQRDHVRQEAITNTSGVLFNPLVDFKATFNSLSPRFTLNYRPVEDTLVYGLFSRGYRPGGFNTNLNPALGAGPALIAAAEAGGYSVKYDQERLDNFEVGLKSKLFGGRVQLNFDAYYDRYSKGQISRVVTFFTAAGNSNQSNLIKNIGRIELKGIEGEAQWRVSRSLLLSGTFALNDSKVKQGNCGDCSFIYSAPSGAGAAPTNNDLAGKHLTIAPKYSATLGAEYTRPLSDDYDGFFRADYAYRGRQYIDQANVAYVGDKHLINLRTGVRSSKYSLELFCTNCFNDLTMDSAIYAQADLFTILSGTRQAILYGLPQRRTFGVRLSTTFGND